MDRLREIETFVAVADHGAFARAAARLNLSAPVVTRTVASLEDRLGVRLFTRTTRSLRLTEAGVRFLDRARLVLPEVEAAEAAARGEAASPRGLLSMTAPASLGRIALPAIMAEFQAAYPDVRLSLTLLDRNTHLIDEGFDVALRVGALADSGLIARRVGAVRRILVASPAYLAQHGNPAVPDDLTGHRTIGFTGISTAHEWRFEHGGRATRLRVLPAIETNDVATALALAEAGEGIAPALSYQAGAAVQAGHLTEVLPAFAGPDLPVHLVHAETRLVAPKTRAFLDFAAPRLSAKLRALTAPVLSSADDG